MVTTFNFWSGGILATLPVTLAPVGTILSRLNRFTPMPLGRRREPFDHPDWLFERKLDGFRTLAHVTGGGSKLISRNGNAFRSFPDLAAELALEVDADDATLDGEIVKLGDDGRPQFYDLMRRRGTVRFGRFRRAGRERQRRPGATTRRAEEAPARGCARAFEHNPLRAARSRSRSRSLCGGQQDLEGIVAKHCAGRYGDDEPKRWLKIKNPEYSQARDRA